ncbi:putative GTP pyrophosphokinase [Pseudomonas chlororaphis]|uniref:GTP pyrophosphokinase n=1 Tax=Pseudomonas chlororaphis TaxID=587753 RepID=UPI0039DF8F2E
MDTSKLRIEYARIESRANRLKTALSAELDHLLAKDGVTLGVPIEARVKEWLSIEEKINRKSLNLHKIHELDDLVGIRLILLFRRDLMAVDKLLRSALTVRSSEDTSLRLADAQLGYQSQHYIVEVPRPWLGLPTWGDLGAIRVEIQVRTLAQHIWAAASHKLQYKHEASVPLPLRRSINRASALLETVDIEFDRLLEDRLSYVKDQLEHENPDEPLNVEILDSVLSKIFPYRNRQDDEPYNDLLIDLNYFGINTADELTQVMEKHMKKNHDLGL